MENQASVQVGEIPKRHQPRRTHVQLPHPRSVRLSKDLDAEVVAYLLKNTLSFNQLCQFAISKFIKEEQTVTLVPVSQVRGNT